MRHKDRYQYKQAGFQMGIAALYRDKGVSLMHGRFMVSLKDKEGKEILSFEKSNVITRDASIAAAMALVPLGGSTAPAFGDRRIGMLSIGSGATGGDPPDAAQKNQRKINKEAFRKEFLSVVFRNSVGQAVNYPTNIVDFTTQFNSGEADGIGLNEMGLIIPNPADPNTPNWINDPSSPVGYDATIDVSDHDILVNYLTFGKITKPGGSTLSITWRLTF